jgi:hypothetical protein
MNVCLYACIAVWMYADIHGRHGGACNKCLVSLGLCIGRVCYKCLVSLGLCIGRVCYKCLVSLGLCIGRVCYVRLLAVQCIGRVCYVRDVYTSLVLSMHVCIHIYMYAGAPAILAAAAI